MIIGIDYRSVLGQKVGIGNYTYNLVNTLSKIDNKNVYILYADKEINFNLTNQNFKLRIFKYPSILWHVRTVLDVLLNKVDVYHTSSFITTILLPFVRCIIFIPDITAFLFPNYHTLKVRLTMKLCKIAIRRARVVLTISLNSKKDIISFFRISHDSVKVTYLAASDSFRVITDSYYLNHIKTFYNLPDKFILFVGSIEPRKNLIGLINAFDKIKAKITHKLVIVGGKGWLNSEIFMTIKMKRLQDDIIFTGYVPDEDLVAIYNLADVFVYPSFYEGFGIPLLEAMACCTPVIASNVSSIPEITKDAALLFDPKNTNELAEKIINVIMDDNFKRKLVNEGLKRQSTFSWQKCANETLKLFESL